MDLKLTLSSKGDVYDSEQKKPEVNMRKVENIKVDKGWRERERESERERERDGS